MMESLQTPNSANRDKTIVVGSDVADKHAGHSLQLAPSVGGPLEHDFYRGGPLFVVHGEALWICATPFAIGLIMDNVERSAIERDTTTLS